MTTNRTDIQTAELGPRLFGLPRFLGDTTDGSEPCRDGPDDGDGPECPDCAAGIPLPLAAVRVGDRVTELGTPTGPFYPVLEVDAAAGLLVLDGRDDDDPVPLPVRILAVDGRAGVLKDPRSSAW